MIAAGGLFGPIKPLRGPLKDASIVIVTVTMTEEEAARGIKVGDEVVLASGKHVTVRGVERVHTWTTPMRGLAFWESEVAVDEIKSGDALQQVVKVK